MPHYYQLDGKLIDKVPYRTKGRESELKDTTVTEARELGLLPSVTTLLQVQAKPAVELWKREQVAKACMVEPFYGADEGAWIRKMAAKGDELSGIAADQGAEIHNWVCALLGGRRPMTQNFILSRKIAEKVCQWLSYNQYTVLETEHTFVSEKYGFAGTIDLKARRHGKVVRLDIKTNDFKTEKDCPDYPEHRAQLAGYGIGEEADPEDEAEVLYVSRQVMGLIVPKILRNPTADERAFMAIGHNWAASKGWRFPAAYYSKMMSYEEIE